MPAFQPPPAFQGDAFQTSSVPTVSLTRVVERLVLRLVSVKGAEERPSDQG